jgi:hypothetical protein
MATMKKQAKAAAVKKGTYYECRWCGQEGTNAPYQSEEITSVCGRMVAGKISYYCSEKCRYTFCAEGNRRDAIKEIDRTNETLDDIKDCVAAAIKHGDKIDPVLLQVAKLFNIYKKVMTLIISGDKSSARKLYDEKKELITDCAEDMLASEEWAGMYMSIINSFAEAEKLMDRGCAF